MRHKTVYLSKSCDRLYEIIEELADLSVNVPNNRGKVIVETTIETLENIQDPDEYECDECDVPALVTEPDDDEGYEDNEEPDVIIVQPDEHSDDSDEGQGEECETIVVDERFSKLSNILEESEHDIDFLEEDYENFAKRMKIG